MGKTIVFSGIDGSGKSAHARKLAHELRSSGKSVKYLWMRGRGRVFLSFPLLALCRLLGITKVHRFKNGLNVSEYPFHSYKPLRFIWPWLQLVDSLIVTTVYVSMRSSSLLIVDRGVVDSFIDACADVHEPVASRILQRLFLSLLPKNSIVLVLDVTEEIAMERKQDIIDINYFRARKKLYNALQQKYGWYRISTDKDFQSVHRNLTDVLERHLQKEQQIA